MPVKPKQTIIVPQTTFDAYWMQEIRIHAHEVGGDATAHVVLRPYNKTTGEISLDSKHVTVNDILKRAVGGDKVLGAALKAIEAAVQAEIDKEA